MNAAYGTPCPTNRGTPKVLVLSSARSESGLPPGLPMRLGRGRGDRVFWPAPRCLSGLQQGLSGVIHQHSTIRRNVDKV